MSFNAARRSRAHRNRLLCALCAAVMLLGGCQSVEHLSRPDQGVTMARPGDWVVAQQDAAPEPTQSGVIFELHHRTQPVRARLRRLARPIAPDAHAPWALLWLDRALPPVRDVQVHPARLGGAEAAHVSALVRDAAQDLSEQLWLANDGGRTFVLEFWGPPQAMQETSESRHRIHESVVLSAPASDAARPQPAPHAQKTLETALWKVTLPDPPLIDLPVDWQIDQISENEWQFHLPARLITIVLLAEALDYPIDSLTYGQVALRDQPRAGALAPMADAEAEVSQASAQLTLDDAGAVAMHIQYRFKTLDKRAIQLVASTPASLAEQNEGIITEFFDALTLSAPPIAASGD